MSLPKSEKICMNGRLVPWDDAKIHLGSHVVHYGSSAFEGIRCYKTPDGSAVFRLDEHLERLYNSAKIYRMDIPVTREAFGRKVMETIEANQLEACYIRPVVWRGYGQLGVHPQHCPVEWAVMVWEWGQYLGPEALEKGVDVCVSSWSRMAGNTLPAMAKVAANYMNSQLIKMEATLGGYSEGIALDRDGYVSEGSGENIFLVLKGRMVTPPLGCSVLPGITRDSVMTLARGLGIPVEEQRIPREMLYLADELFFTGTAAEISPIRSVDRIVVGRGARGPLTERLQGAFFDVIERRAPDEHGWLTFVKELGTGTGTADAALGAAGGKKA